MLILFLIVFVDLVGFGLIIPLLPFYGEHFQASPATVGLLMATFSLAQLFAAPWWGRVSDDHGRKPVLAVSMIGSAASYLLLAFADTLAMLFVARALAGFMAGNLSAAFAYIADVTTPQNRAKGMGMIGAAFGLGFIFGPAIGGVLAGHDPAAANYTLPALVAAGLSTLAALLTIVRLPESLPPQRRAEHRQARGETGRWRHLAEALRRPLVGRLIVISFLATFVFAGMETTFAMWSRRQFGWGPEQNGYVFAFVGILSTAVQGGLIGRLVKRFREPVLLVTGAILLAISMLLIPASLSLWVLLPAMAFAACGFSLMMPSLNSLISRQVGAAVQGGTMGVARSAGTLARILGPICAGGLFEYLGKDWPFWGGAVVMGLVVGLCYLLALRSPAP